MMNAEWKPTETKDEHDARIMDLGYRAVLATGEEFRALSAAQDAEFARCNEYGCTRPWTDPEEAA